MLLKSTAMGFSSMGTRKNTRSGRPHFPASAWLERAGDDTTHQTPDDLEEIQFPARRHAPDHEVVAATGDEHLRGGHDRRRLRGINGVDEGGGPIGLIR